MASIKKKKKPTDVDDVGIGHMRTNSGHLYLEDCQYRSVVILELMRRILYAVRRYNCF